jgi:hypothetical protein
MKKMAFQEGGLIEGDNSVVFYKVHLKFRMTRVVAFSERSLI